MTTALTRDDDLLGIRVAHRIMRGEARRYAVIAARWADGTDVLDRRRRAVFADWVPELCADVHHHHAVEDDVLWPVLERTAGAEIDLAPLSDDHAALDPVLDDVRAALAVAVAGGEVRPLAERLTHLADLLDEHIVEEERVMFPVVLRYVPEADWRRVERAAQRGGAGMRWILPRIEAVSSPDELAHMAASAPAVLSLMLRVLRRGYRRRERILAGR